MREKITVNLRPMIMVLGVVVVVGLSACAPKVGSPEWCDAMDKKAKGDWTANDVKDYAKHCIFRSHEK